MTVIAMAISSQPTPRFASIEKYWTATTTPAIPDVKPDKANSVTVVRATGTPRFLAAVGFCPIAKAQLPMRVRSRNSVASSRDHEEPQQRHAVAEQMLAGDHLRVGRRET